jgi:6-phosphogluconate dehydrogenase (decarboxylating)
LREITCINSADVTPGDIVVDGGNSYYHDDIRRAADRKAKRLHYVDAGVSGGIWGKDGYCRMIGREQEIVTRLGPILRALAPGVGAAPERGIDFRVGIHLGDVVEESDGWPIA